MDSKFKQKSKGGRGIIFQDEKYRKKTLSDGGNPQNSELNPS
jgi:hypothetical protein